MSASNTCRTIGGVLAVASFLLAPTLLAQSDTRSSPVVAAPIPQGASPFLPSIDREMRLPVMLDGFCIVTLREQQEWAVGSESHQLVFDRKLYWFASQRERAMFAAAPQRYVPALGGDCVVTLNETGQRKLGKPRYGILHDQRLYFFRGAGEQETFRAEPAMYANADLANEGRCLVSQTDDSRQLPGLPETTVIVGGMRYQFAGVHRQRRFLQNMASYGVTKPELPEVDGARRRIASSPPPALAPGGAASRPKVKKAQPIKKKRTSVANVKNMAMGGYCPVSILQRGTWVAGNGEYLVEFDGLNYLLAGEDEARIFAENPSSFVPALGGHCVVNEIDNNRRVPGSIYHAAQFEGRLFLFAGADEKKAFKASPATYVNADLAVDGNCIVSYIDQGIEVPGLPELTLWHQSKRYSFSSEQQRDQFLQNLERYQEP